VTVALVCAASAQDTEGGAKKSKGKGRGGPSRNFDDQTVGQVPSGWTAAETNGKGKPGKWEVVADATAPSTPNVVALTKTQNAGDTVNLLVAGGRKMADIQSLEVKVKALSGKADQGGGLIWRMTDDKNYYVARWNPLEKNLCLYCVKDGKRNQLKAVEVTGDAKAWHTIKVSQMGDKITVAFDDKPLIEATDATLTEAGGIGLWTKADAATAFDDVQIRGVQPAGNAKKKKAQTEEN
jgi:hypothetical protein